MTELPTRAPFLIGKDLILLAMAPLGWVLPDVLWRPFASLLSSARARLSPRAKQAIRSIHAVAADTPDLPSPAELYVTMSAGFLEQHLQDCREFRMGGWQPQIELHGEEHVRGPLSKGKGAILWVAPFLSSGLVAKKGLHQSGLEVLHLSRVEHGPSSSRFGVRFINPIRIAAENRYLSERVVMAPGDELGAVRRIMHHLSHNGVVSMTATSAGRQTSDPSFLGGRWELATGAPGIAVRSGAGLLPVVTVRLAHDRFRVVIGAPLVPSPDRTDDPKSDLIRQFAAHVERWTLQSPDSSAIWPQVGGFE